MHDGFARHVAGAVTASQFLGLSERLGRFPLISWCVESRFGGVQALGKNGGKKDGKLKPIRIPQLKPSSMSRIVTLFIQLMGF